MESFEQGSSCARAYEGPQFEEREREIEQKKRKTSTEVTEIIVGVPNNVDSIKPSVYMRTGLGQRKRKKKTKKTQQLSTK